MCGVQGKARESTPRVGRTSPIPDDLHKLPSLAPLLYTTSMYLAIFQFSCGLENSRSSKIDSYLGVMPEMCHYIQTTENYQQKH